MGLTEKLLEELEAAQRGFHHILDTLPEAAYVHPSLIPGWTNGNVLYHITLGPPAIRVEIWMVRNTPWVFKALTPTTSRLFNRGNALFARHPKRITRQGLLKAYAAGHAGLASDLKRMNEFDLTRAVIYPEFFVSELAGVVTIERLYRYIKLHFDVHAGQIKNSREA